MYLCIRKYKQIICLLQAKCVENVSSGKLFFIHDGNTMNDNEEKIRRIKKVQERLGLKDVELAGRAGMTRSHVSKILSGKINVTGDVIMQLTQAFPEVNPLYLMGMDCVVLKKDKDELSDLCEDSIGVLAELMVRECVPSLEELEEKTCCHSLHFVVEYDRGFTAEEVNALRRTFRHYCLNWLMYHEGPALESLSTKVEEMKRRLRRECESQ